MFCVVAPFDHSHDEPGLALSKTESPAQTVVALAGVIADNGPDVKVALMVADTPLHPDALITVSEINPPAFIYVFCVVAPVDH